jgi:hypothetical protein
MSHPVAGLFAASQFHALDRETDIMTTLVLLAAPSLTDNFRSVASRTVRRNCSPNESTDMVGIRTAFAELAARWRASCSLSPLEQLSWASSSKRAGSPLSNSDARKGDLPSRRALDTPMGSLHAFGSLYERREVREIEDKDKVQPLEQVLGVGVVGNLDIESP